MSYDKVLNAGYCGLWSLNPFGTGQCLTTFKMVSKASMESSQSLWNRAVSYDGSDCLIVDLSGLNPFGTGQCLTTLKHRSSHEPQRSQSLWNRAVSYD